MARITVQVLVAVDIDTDTEKIHAATIEGGAPECFDPVEQEWHPLTHIDEEAAALRADAYVGRALEMIAAA